MCGKSVYQCPLHEGVWDFGDAAAKSHLCVAPRETSMSPAPERALLSSEQHSGGSYLSGCLWSSNTKCFSSSDRANSPASPAGFTVLSSLELEAGPAAFWHWVQWEVCACKASGSCGMQLHWSGRSRAVCFEFSFSCQNCYLPNPLTLQCSSGCFKDLNKIDWNPKLKYRWVLFISSSLYNSYFGAKAAAVIFSTF